MRRDRNYERAVAQTADKVGQAGALLAEGSSFMLERRPNDAWELYNEAKTAIEGAMVVAKWAQTLPAPEDE